MSDAEHDHERDADVHALHPHHQHVVDVDPLLVREQAPATEDEPTKVQRGEDEVPDDRVVDDMIGDRLTGVDEGIERSKWEIARLRLIVGLSALREVELYHLDRRLETLMSRARHPSAETLGRYELHLEDVLTAARVLAVLRTDEG